jgi:hypothetical protein
LRRILLLTLLLTLLVGPVTVRAADDGSIGGVVISGSANSTPVAGLEVRLTVFDDMKAAADYKTTTDDAGNYEFTGLETDLAFSYRLETDFAEMPYVSGFLQFPPDETLIPWDFTVYETTADPGVVSLVMAHVIMAAGEGYLSVTEYHVVANGSSLAYVGAMVEGEEWREVLSFAVPEGASALEFAEGLTDIRMWPEGSGFSDGATLRPGMREVVFTYLIPFTEGEKSLDLGFDYPVNALNLLVENRGIEVSTTLVASEPLVMESSQYLVFIGQGIAAGEPINLTLKMASGDTGGIGVWVWVLVALIVGGMVVGVVLIWSRRRAAPVAEIEDEGNDSVILLQTLAQLDDEFEAGKIPEADYQRQRALVKEQLVSLMRPAGGEDTP